MELLMKYRKMIDTLNENLLWRKKNKNWL